ncbi:MAG: hypothetical protein DSY59_04925, partial [Persephonella sp.]
MTKKIPKDYKSKGITLIGVEEEEKEKEEKKLDPKTLKKVKELKRKLTIHISILFTYKVLVIPIYIYILIKSYLITDTDFLDKFHKVKFILTLDIQNFLLYEVILIFILHTLNLFILHSFFQKALENKNLIKHFGQGSIVKRFTEFLEKNDTFKFFVYLLNVFLPLLIMVYIFFKSGKLHNILFYFLNSIVIALATLFIVIFLYRNMETFDFGRKLDILIWSFLYIVFSIFILHAYFIYFSLKFNIGNKIAYITFFILFFISIS